MRLGVVTHEVNVAGHRDDSRADDLQSQIRHAGNFRLLQKRADHRRADPGVRLFADQKLSIPVDQVDRDRRKQQADQDRPDGVRNGGSGQLMCAETGGGDDQADQRRRVFGKDVMTCSITSRSISWAPGFAWRTDRKNETPSSTRETASTA